MEVICDFDNDEIVFENLNYGDVFSFEGLGYKGVYIKVKDNYNPRNQKAVNLENGEIINLGGLEAVIVHNYKIVIN